jgi:hypothetical protein
MPIPMLKWTPAWVTRVPPIKTNASKLIFFIRRFDASQSAGFHARDGLFAFFGRITNPLEPSMPLTVPARLRTIGCVLSDPLGLHCGAL